MIYQCTYKTAEINIYINENRFIAELDILRNREERVFHNRRTDDDLYELMKRNKAQDIELHEIELLLMM